MPVVSAGHEHPQLTLAELPSEDDPLTFLTPIERAAVRVMRGFMVIPTPTPIQSHIWHPPPIVRWDKLPSLTDHSAARKLSNHWGRPYSLPRTRINWIPTPGWYLVDLGERSRHLLVQIVHDETYGLMIFAFNSRATNPDWTPKCGRTEGRVWIATIHRRSYAEENEVWITTRNPQWFQTRNLYYLCSRYRGMMTETIRADMFFVLGNTFGSWDAAREAAGRFQQVYARCPRCLLGYQHPTEPFGPTCRNRFDHGFLHADSLRAEPTQTRPPRLRIVSSRNNDSYADFA